MPGGLYGELELVKSTGHTALTSPIFLTSTILAYVSGNRINFVDSALPAQQPTDASGTTSNPLKSIQAANQISSFALWRKESVVAYVERDSSVVRLVKWPSGSLLGLGKLEAAQDVYIQHLAFSNDGQYLAALGSLPTFTITVWDWRNGTIVCQAKNDRIASMISFSPMDSRWLCASGEEGVTFWRIEHGHKRNTMKAIIGHAIPVDESVPRPLISLAGPRPTDHTWTIDSQVLCTTHQANELVHYDPMTGNCRLFLEAQELEDEDDQDDGRLRKGQLACAMIARDGIMIGGRDGCVRWYSFASDSITKTFVVAQDTTITRLIFSPEYRTLVAECDDGRLFTHKMSSDEFTLVVDSPRSPTSLAFFRSNNTFAAISSRHIHFYSTEDPLKHTVVASHLLPTTPTSICTSPLLPILVMGTSYGTVRIYDCRDMQAPAKLLTQHHVHDSEVLHMDFDATGRFLATCARDGRVTLFETFSEFEPFGYLKVENDVRACAWCLEEDIGTILFLYILTADESQKTSFIHRFTLPLDRKRKKHSDGKIRKANLQSVVYRIDDLLIDMIVAPNHLTAGRETFYVTSVDKRLKAYQGPAGAKAAAMATAAAGRDESRVSQDIVHLGAPSYETLDHEKPLNKVRLSATSEVLLTASSDGTITLRTLLEPDKIIRLYTHDSYQGGCAAVATTRDCRTLVTLGRDGLIKFWEWKYSVAGRRAATETTTMMDRVVEGNKAISDELEANLARLPPIEDGPDSETPADVVLPRADQPTAAPPPGTAAGPAPGTASSSQTDIPGRLQTLKDRLLKAIAKNESLPPLEQLDREEFVLDYEERDRLLGQADGKVELVRRQIEEQNSRKRIIGMRIKQECWDSMQVVGQAIKSFHPDPLTGRPTTITNYPIRKRHEAVAEKLNRVMLLRKVGMLVASATAKVVQKKGTRDVDLSNELDVSETENEATPQSKDTAATSPSAPATTPLPPLLFTPFELTTNDRRRTQLVLLEDHIQTLKEEFNKKFGEVAKMKRDEIGKIEERGERCKGIMEELGGVEGVEIFKPVLDEEEEPERVVEVRDEEVKCERFITAEEQQRLAEKQRQEAERARAAAVDNIRDRALTQMMNGKLDDRSAEDETKAVLAKPDWMVNKPSTEWSDEERKLAKEFEKKLATQKEEQEKTRKALETELKKLLASIFEICDQFDAVSLRQTLFENKLRTDNVIYQHELVLVKLLASILFASEDEAKEQAITARLEACKAEKMHYQAEIPEIKKDLERCKEEYEAAVRRDKEVERAFRKEFGAQGMDNWWEACWRLFKKRDTLDDLANGEGGETGGQDMNTYAPYPTHQQQQQQQAQQQQQQQQQQSQGQPQQTSRPASHRATTQYSFLPPPTPAPLNQTADNPEGLPPELFQSLVAHRQRKIQTEADLHSASQMLQNLQSLISNLLEASDQIRMETEQLTNEMNGFVEYRFGSMFDLEVLVGLKQGQVEVPQAPVVTDYSDAVLVHRSVVERLNEAIVALGQTKVDALKEMKEYRRGIHALEWETKMLDFQAESLTQRTRDIQLLRVTKSMQEFIRGGDDKKHLHEIAALEKRAEHSIRAHQHKLSELKALTERLGRKVRDKGGENRKLESKVNGLMDDVRERRRVAGVMDDEDTDEPEPPLTELPPKHSNRKNVLGSIYARRRLIDLAKSQAQDIAILREEVERLRLRTYPAFPARRPEF
ncbi:hypothetical protein DFS34DRAFT_665339 [Phlyctochytrium arcticum]|nr:hypothetical protein DFS34DRAFT_665339 [Phlyctochytrium arcticum]